MHSEMRVVLKLEDCINDDVKTKSTTTLTASEAKKYLLDVSNVVIDSKYNSQKKEENKLMEKMEKNKDDIEPHLLLIVSGKRKSGKDFISSKLVEHFLNDDADVRLITLSANLKEQYAKENNLDYERLLDASDYKEKYRADMIKWSDLKREKDPFFFCQKAVDSVKEKYATGACQSSHSMRIWIVTDARRKSDLRFFGQFYPSQCKTIRVVADESVRLKRNWVFTKGVDDTISETDLDDVKSWDFTIENNHENDRFELEKSLKALFEFIDSLKSLINSNNNIKKI